MSDTSHELLKSRLDFVQLDEEARQRLARLRPLIDAHLGPALDRFYDHIAEVPAVASFFSGRPHMKGAQAKQVGHWKAIASGQLDAEYFESSTRIGLRHAKIGLEPRWHIGGYSLIVETLLTGIITDFMTEALKPEKGSFGRSKPRGPESSISILAYRPISRSSTMMLVWPMKWPNPRSALLFPPPVRYFRMWLGAI
jgi:methyl-accepting chemotaxis protein